MNESDPDSTKTSTQESVTIVGDGEEFADSLSSLIQAAQENGVNVEGGYDYVSENSESDYGIEIYEVAGGYD